MKPDKVRWKRVNKLLRYRVRNGHGSDGYIEFDIGLMLKSIARIEELKYEPFDKLYIYTSTIKNRINHKALGIIVDGLNHAIPTKKDLRKRDTPQTRAQRQQKIDWNTAKPEKWSKKAVLGYISFVFLKTYGINSVEIDFAKEGKPLARQYAKINSLMERFQDNPGDIKSYIDWVFCEKADKIDISIGFLKADSVIQSWLIFKKGVKKSGNRLSKKWK